MNIIPINPLRRHARMSEAELRQLADAYLEGTTTNEQEARLREYFTSADADIPADLSYLHALFAYEKQNQRPRTETASAGKTPTRRLAAWIAVAAAAAVAALIVLPRLTESSDYVVIDGQRYASEALVRQEAEAMLDMVSYSNDSFSALDLMNNGEVNNE